MGSSSGRMKLDVVREVRRKVDAEERKKKRINWDPCENLQVKSENLVADT